jgi:hypothetical protein
LHLANYSHPTNRNVTTNYFILTFKNDIIFRTSEVAVNFDCFRLHLGIRVQLHKLFNGIVVSHTERIRLT